MGRWANTIDRIMGRYVEKTDSCWVWTGGKNYGYGQAAFEGKKYKAHRLIYEALKGPIPEEMTLDHLCRNRACVNPDHLEIVTRGENVLRGVSDPANNARKTHCVHGHELSGSNLYYLPHVNTRRCRICKRRAFRDWRARQRLLVPA